MKALLRNLPVLLSALFALFVVFQTVQVQAQTLTAADWAARGDAFLDQGSFGEAADAYREAVQMEAGLPDGHIGLAKVAYEKGDWPEAGARLDHALALAPDNMEAHYLRAMVHRELAKFHALSGIPEWANAREEFEWVLRRDSSYRDVLYQYALLRRYGSDYEDALRLGHMQILLKPELDEPRRGLFMLYQTFLNHTRPEKALAWLEANPSEYGEFMRGELLRRQGKLAEAGAVYEAMLGRTLTIPRQPVLLASARIFYALDQPLRGQERVEQAIEEIRTPSQAHLVVEDFKYLFNDAELEHYRALRTPEAYRSFFKAFWARRDPVPAGRENARMTEHYRRLQTAEKEYVFDGLRFWNNDPDKLNELDFPAAYALNQEFNDKGLIYLRHGEPDDRIVTVSGDMNFFSTQTTATPKADWLPVDQSFEAGWVPNESWRYRTPLMDFHFVIDRGAGANNWRITPAITNLNMLEDREGWGGVYARLAAVGRTLRQQREQAERNVQNVRSTSEQVIAQGGQTTSGEADPTALSTTTVEPPTLSGQEPGRSPNAPTFDLITFREEMVENSREFVSLGLTTDRHTWQEEVKPLEAPYVLAAFRDRDKKTRLEVHFALPIGRLTREIGSGVNTVDVEVGCALFDTEWTPVREDALVKHMPPVPDEEAAAIDFCGLTAAADSYHVAFHSRPVQTSRLGGYRFDYAMPDYSGNGLLMSDLLPASSIKPTIGPSRFNKGDLYISANPFRRFSVRQPVYLYFEVYNLTRDGDDQTRYTVEYTLTPEKERKKVLGLFGGGDQPALSLRTERTGAEASPQEHAEIDVGKVDPGNYTLTVAVKNELSGEETQRSIALELTE